MKVLFCCDSGANIQSCRKEIVEVNDLGYSDDEWRALSDDEKNDVAVDWANDRMEIWYEEIEDMS